MTISVSLPRRMIVTGSAEKAGVVLKMSDSLDEMEVETIVDMATLASYSPTLQMHIYIYLCVSLSAHRS